MWKFKNIIYLFLCFLLLTSCSNFRKIQKSDDWKVKYQAAITYYESKDYNRAGILFEEIFPIVKGSKEAERTHFYFAYCNYYQSDYVLASHYFKSFYESYGRSEYAQEAMYMYAYSLYMQSPTPSLDQTSSYEAIVAMQNFINRFPQSSYKEQANEIINLLQVKLEVKAYENAKLYYQLDIYKSAIVSFQNFQNDYPDSDYNEEIAFLKIEAQYKLAVNSFVDKQKERFQKTVEFYETFIDRYPQSKFLKTAEGYYENSLEFLSKLK